MAGTSFLTFFCRSHIFKTKRISARKASLKGTCIKNSIVSLHYNMYTGCYKFETIVDRALVAFLLLKY